MDARARTLTLIACVLGSAIVFIDPTVVNVALPAIADDLGASLAQQQWMVESYLLMLGSLVLVGGSLGDVLGRRLIFAAGVAGFGVTSALCALAPSPGVLIAARTLQGLTGALLVPSSLAIIAAIYEGEELGRAIGRRTAATSAMIAFGPPLGGAIVDASSWRLVFLMNVPLAIGALALTARAAPVRVPSGQPGGRELARVQERATVAAFHRGVLVSALLVAAGGLVALGGLRPQRAAAAEPLARPAAA